MTYQYKREPLSSEEEDKLVNACSSHEEKLAVWTLLDTGLRVSELSSLALPDVLWQEKRIVCHGKRADLSEKRANGVLFRLQIGRGSY
jgi:integrase/recombinase XerD